jgi:hypothetical protein
MIGEFDVTSANAPGIGNWQQYQFTVAPSAGNNGHGILLSFLSSTANGNQPLQVDYDLPSVPGPVVGAGLPGLMADCGGLLALARRRRQKFA